MHQEEPNAFPVHSLHDHYQWSMLDSIPASPNSTYKLTLDSTKPAPKARVFELWATLLSTQLSKGGLRPPAQDWAQSRLLDFDWLSWAQNFDKNGRVTEKNKIITNQFVEKQKLCQMAWRSMPKELTFWILTKLFCNNGFAKYHPAFNVHNYLQSESKSFVFNSSCDWRSCLSETFCSSDRSSAQTFMSKYIKQLRGKQNFQFLDKDLRLFFDKIDAKFIWSFPKNVCRLFFDCPTIEQKLNRNWKIM